MSTLLGKHPDGAVTLLLNAQAVGVICNQSVSSAEKARLINQQDVQTLLDCCTAEKNVLRDLCETLSKLLVEREEIGSMATLKASEMLRFAGYLNMLLTGLNNCGRY